MFEISQIRGKKEVIANLNKVQYNIQASLVPSLLNASDILRDKAIENVMIRAKEPGLSIQGEKITDISSWKKEMVDNNKISLTCISPHATIVEYGGLSPGEKILAPDYGKNAWPIGKQQGFVNAFTGAYGIPRVSFRTQQPMAYLGDAAIDPNVVDSMLGSIKRDLWSSIESVL